VLIIAYYWPPSGGSGVQRWLKFVKYLPQYGWEPHVFTPENPSFAIKDESLLKDVPEDAEIIRFPIWEPYDLFFRFMKLCGKKRTAKPTEVGASGKKSFSEKIINWIRGNFFIPDPRVFWVRPSFQFLHGYLHDNDIGTVITTGPPHSIHLIGLRLKRKNPDLRWLADFRDPWSEWGLLDSLHAGKRARNYHKRLESEVLANADEVITITPFFVKRFAALGNRHVQLLTNGFDEDDFKGIAYSHTDKFIIRHVGIINERCDPRPFMIAVKEARHERADFREHVRIEFIGEVHPQFKSFAGSPDFRNITAFTGNIPHKELIGLYGSSSLLLLVLTGYKDPEGYMPGKLFEYIATGLPVLGVGPVSGDAAALLTESGAGQMIASENVTGIKNSLLANFDHWKASTQASGTNSGKEKYSRRVITSRLVDLLLSR
jgi:glycosyltransferase involved in cell wall biosynthesis